MWWGNLVIHQLCDEEIILDISFKEVLRQHKNGWIRLRLPSYRPGFVSHALHLCFYEFLFELCLVENTKNKKETGIGPFKNNNLHIKFTLLGTLALPLFDIWLQFNSHPLVYMLYLLFFFENGAFIFCLNIFR